MHRNSKNVIDGKRGDVSSFGFHKKELGEELLLKKPQAAANMNHVDMEVLNDIIADLMQRDRKC